jgi:flagellar protein FliS
MTPYPSTLVYRKAALEHASTVGLVIALYDTLLGNLSRAATAIERGDIENRCAELLHGFKILQQLDCMLDMQKGGVAALNLRRLYALVRKQMMLSQFKLSPSALREQIRLLIDVREAWQQVDARGAQPAAPPVDPRSELKGNILHGQVVESELARTSFSCSG